MRTTSHFTLCLALLGLLTSVHGAGVLYNWDVSSALNGTRNCKIVQSDYLQVYSCEDYSQVRLTYADTNQATLYYNSKLSKVQTKFTTNYTSYPPAVYNKTAAINYNCTNIVTWSVNATDIVKVGLNFTLNSSYCGPVFLTSSYVITNNLVNNSNVAFTLTTGTPIPLDYKTPIEYVEAINNPVTGTPSSSLAVVSNCGLDIISIAANGTTTSQMPSGPFDLSKYCLCDSIGSMTSDKLIKYLSISCTDPNTTAGAPKNLTQLLFRFDLQDPQNLISLVYSRDYVFDSNMTMAAGSTTKINYFATIATYLDVSMWTISFGNQSTMSATIYEPVSRIIAPLFQIDNYYIYGLQATTKYAQWVPYYAGNVQVLYVNYMNSSTIYIPMCFPKYNYFYYDWFGYVACPSCSSTGTYSAANLYAPGYQNGGCFACTNSIKFNGTNYTASSINMCNNVTQCTLPSTMNSVLTSAQNQNFAISPYKSAACLANCSDPFTLSGGTCTMKTSCSSITTCMGCFSNSACTWSNGTCTALANGATAATQTLATVSSTCPATEYCSLTTTANGIYYNAPANTQSVRTMLCQNTYTFNLTGSTNNYTIKVIFLNASATTLNTGEVVQIMNGTGNTSLVNFTGSNLNYFINGSLTTVQIKYFKPSGVTASSLQVVLVAVAPPPVVVNTTTTTNSTSSTNTNTTTTTNTSTTTNTTTTNTNTSATSNTTTGTTNTSTNTSNTTTSATTTCKSNNNCMACTQYTKSTCYWDYSLGTCSSSSGSTTYSSATSCWSQCIVSNVQKSSYSKGQVITSLEIGAPASPSSTVNNCSAYTFKVSDFFSNVSTMAFIILGNTTQEDNDAANSGGILQISQSSVGIITYPTWSGSNMLVKLVNLTASSTISLYYSSNDLQNLDSYNLVVVAVSNTSVLPGYGFPANSLNDSSMKYLVASSSTSSTISANQITLTANDGEDFQQSSNFIVVIAVPAGILGILIIVVIWCCLRKREEYQAPIFGPAGLPPAKDITNELVNVREYEQFYDENCPVCLEPMTGIVRFYPCNVHVSHTSCAHLWAASAPARLNGFLCVYRCTVAQQRPSYSPPSSPNNLGIVQPMRSSNTMERLNSNIMVIVDKNSREQAKPEGPQPEYENPGVESPEYQAPDQYEEEHVVIDE